MSWATSASDLAPQTGPRDMGVLTAPEAGQEDLVKGRKHTPEQIIRKLREADRMVAEGKATAEVAKALEVSEWTLSRWRTQYGGMKADDAKRLKELERENSRLKRMVADQALDIDMLKELARENGEPVAPTRRRPLPLRAVRRVGATGVPADGTAPR